MTTITETTGDASAGADTTYNMVPGDTFTGRLGERFDQDWIRIELQEGLTYEINLNGDGADGAADTILRIYNSAGVQVAMNDDVDLAAGNLFSMLNFTPESSGTYYIGATSYSANPSKENWGNYRITVSNPGGIGLEDEDSDTMEGEDNVIEDSRDSGEENLHLNDAFTLVIVANRDAVGGSDGADEQVGGAGNDVIAGTPGADTIRGGAGNDIILYVDSYPGVEIRLYDGTARGGDAEGDMLIGRQTIEYLDAAGNTRYAEATDIEAISGSPNDDILVGAQGDNWLFGGGGDDVLDGREGNDLLLGNSGADELRGGPGEDTASYKQTGINEVVVPLYYGDEAQPRAVTVVRFGVEVRLYDGTSRGGVADGDTFTGMQTLEYVDAEGNTQSVEVPDIENLFGSRNDDILAGALGANRLYGHDGDDRLDGRGGDDWLYGGHGEDILIGGPGADVLSGGSYIFDTASYESSGAGVIIRLHSVLETGGKGGDAEGDTFITYTFTDDDGTSRDLEIPDIAHLIGSNYDDILAGDFRGNWIDGQGGDDRLFGGPDGGQDFLFGGDGDDKVYGGKGNDSLYGGYGDDLLKGGPHDDSFEEEHMVRDNEKTTRNEIYFKIERSDYGNDQLEGGAGDDYFYFHPDGGNDTILDFGNGEDKIVLRAFEDIRSTGDLTLQQQGDNLVIDLSGQGGGTITLQDYSEADLMDAHFQFYTDDSAAAA